MTNKTVCLGRLQEYLDTLTDSQRLRAGVKPGKGIFDDYTVKLFKSRETLARLIRKEERDKCLGEVTWYAAVKLGDGEGY